mgnify:CR=1 FL=1|tara:strand:+ start:3087 stop:3518 length:432 start_codon:yes stop_codon:yes gene_type:complete
MEQIKSIKNFLIEYRIIFLKDNKIILHDISKTNSKKIILKKYKSRKKQVELTRIEISYHTGAKFYQGGPIQLNFKQYIYQNNKLKLIKSYGNTGSIWINKKFLQRNYFKNKKKILNTLLTLSKNVNLKKNIKIPGINLITNFL